MKNPWITLMGALTLATALPAFAGPDWHVIEQARKAKTGQEAGQGAVRAAKTHCSPGALALALDHGPRAQITPHQNRLREQGQARTCA